jgi:hypothetical protein
MEIVGKIEGSATLPCGRYGIGQTRVWRKRANTGARPCDSPSRHTVGERLSVGEWLSVPVANTRLDRAINYPA